MLKYLIAVVLLIVLLILEFFKSKISKKIIYFLKPILIVILLEVTIFNINSYRTDLGNLKYIELNKQDIEKNIQITDEDTQCLVIDNIDLKIKSIYLKLDNLAKNQVVDYNIYYSDESTSTRFLSTKSYCQDVEKTKYSVVSFSR